MRSTTQQEHLKQRGFGAAGPSGLPLSGLRARNYPFLKIALGEYSFNHSFRAGKYDLLDYDRILRIVVDLGYRGYVGIEWDPEGAGLQMSDEQGIQATKNILERKLAAFA